VPTFNRFNTLQVENPDFQRKNTTENLAVGPYFQDVIEEFVEGPDIIICGF
jgi:hypothetical protein